MANAHDLIKAALRGIRVIDANETPSADMSQDGLEALQIMLDGWSAIGLLIYAQTTENFTLSATATYTWGSGGTFNSARPEKVIGAYIRSGGVDYPVGVSDAGEYRETSQKSIGAQPSKLFYSPEYPLGKVYFNSVPTSGDVIYIDSLKPLTEPTVLTSSISFPPGYERAIKYNLMVEMAPEYGAEITEVIAKRASNALDVLVSKNAAAKAETVRLDIPGSTNGSAGGLATINGG